MQNNIEKLQNYEKTNLPIFTILEHSANILNNKMNFETKKMDDSFDLLDIAVFHFLIKIYEKIGSEFQF